MRHWYRRHSEIIDVIVYAALCLTGISLAFWRS